MATRKSPDRARARQRTQKRAELYTLLDKQDSIREQIRAKRAEIKRLT